MDCLAHSRLTANPCFAFRAYSLSAKALQPQLVRAEPCKSFALGSTRQKNSCKNHSEKNADGRGRTGT
mgnify:CR=1 FL=1